MSPERKLTTYPLGIQSKVTIPVKKQSAFDGDDTQPIDLIDLREAVASVIPQDLGEIPELPRECELD